MKYLAFFSLITFGSSWAGDVICAPYFELNNLGQEFKVSTLKLFKNKIEEDNNAKIIIPNKDTARTTSLGTEENLEWARQNQCTHLLLGSLTRLGESVSFNVKYLNANNGSIVFNKSYKASEPEDLDPILSQLADKVSQPGYASLESIYDVTNADVRALRKKRSSAFYGGSIGSAIYTQNIKLYQLSTMALWDNRTFIGELEYQVGFSAGSVPYTANFLAIRIYKPHTDNSNSFYYGGGIGFGEIQANTDDYSSNYSTSTEQNLNAGGLLLTGSVGYMIGRTTDFRVRGQIDLNALTTTFNTDKSIPIGGGVKVVLEFGN